ncbi:DUF4132 domain-containing protein [Bacillus sp. DX4.1]|uniref:DUF4132 domain-containing protein n=1 Tax=Bacillus sp. DX4.1 TaxID=3055867 RepID=UPI0025A0FBD4|nr:DUF4132 domain-containing protein [Bacillus sp. DX4.1]MDM5190624.1 DUF4132 domain-containing protein [Bacillus sp. DX4.1]
MNETLLQQLEGKSLEIVKNIMGIEELAEKNHQIYQYDKISNFALTLKSENTTQIETLWEQGLGVAVGAIIDDEKQVKEFYGFLEQLRTISYQVGYYRRSYKSEKPVVDHAHTIAALLVALPHNNKVDVLDVLMNLSQFQHQYSGAITWYAHKKTNVKVVTTAYFLAKVTYELRQKNRVYEEAVEEILFGENQVATLRHAIIQAIVQSDNERMIEGLGKLLLAAKRQEGLRQAILETVDRGTLSSLIYFMRLIQEHDLIRFSSVQRAISTWMGLGYEVEDKKIIGKTFTTALALFEGDMIYEECIESEDLILNYAALWSKATQSKELVLEEVQKLLGKKKHQQLSALYFLKTLQDHEIAYPLVEPLIFQTEDLDVLAFALPFLIPTNASMRYPSYNHVFYEGKLQEDYHFMLHFSEELYKRIHTIREQLKNVSHTIEGKPFPWIHTELSKEFLWNLAMLIAHVQQNQEWMTEILQHADEMSSDNRANLLSFLPKTIQSPTERQFLFNTLKDRSLSNREEALQKIRTLTLDEEERQQIVQILALKTGSLRQLALKILIAQDDEFLKETIPTLLADRKQDVRLGGLSLLSTILKEERCTQEDIAVYTEKLAKPTAKEVTIIEDLLKADTHQYTRKNGFGLYKPDYDTSKIPRLQEVEPIYLQALMDFDVDVLMEKMKKLSDLIHENRMYAYETANMEGTRIELLLGNQRIAPLYDHAEEFRKEPYLHHYPLADLWKTWMEEVKLTWWDCQYIQLYKYKSYYSKRSWKETVHPEAFPLFEQLFDLEKADKLNQLFSELPYTPTINQLLSIMQRKFLFEKEENVFYFFYQACIEIFQKVDLKDWHTKNILSSWGDPNPFHEHRLIESYFRQLKVTELTDADFEKRLAVHWELTQRMQKENEEKLAIINLEIEEFCRAIDLGLLTEDALFAKIFQKNQLANALEVIFERSKREALQKKYPFIEEIYERIMTRLLEIELTRGDSETEVSSFISRNFREVVGVKTFVNLLVLMDGLKYVRGYTWSSEYTKREIFSELMKISSPKKEETVEDLKAALVPYKIEDERLLDAMMYSPKWIPLVSEYVGWKGLLSTAWYFKAHASDDTNSYEMNVISHYSSLSKEDFNDGVFDLNWFKEAYKEIGKKRFNQVYESAKYASEGSNHRRAQLFADAVLGKLRLKPLLEEIEDKRNKDKLRCVGLIPLSKRIPEKDAWKRYKFLQKFLKESKQFGAQRRESEGLAVRVALANLARNAGFDDVTRFIWKMELFSLKERAAYMKPTQIEDVEMWLEVDSLGVAQLIVQKEGKTLKSVPTRLKKNAKVVKFQEIRKEMREQQKRSKKSLEEAMETSTAFQFGELQELLRHPVIAPLLKTLVVKVDQHLGYVKEDGLLILKGGLLQIDADETAILAHPYHLYEAKQWRAFQHDLFEKEMKQPFKQVFRELYLVNADEREATKSRRYAGHQIQPQKTVALLKNRQWRVTYDAGLRKIHYDADIVATLYAMCDWFTPADIESPTLEYVYFYHRRTDKTLHLEDIPPIVYSEIMRDVDLVVSVAHVGGVDPEASHSTIETRAAIVEELMKLLKIDNVSVKGHHAIIQGKLGEYSIHLGSGVIHQIGGQMIPVIAVPSQHRGRIFLPFADEDPRTAEIMSKILLFSEDEKIKDPMILENIQ